MSPTIIPNQKGKKTASTQLGSQVPYLGTFKKVTRVSKGLIQGGFSSVTGTRSASWCSSTGSKA